MQPPIICHFKLEDTQETLSVTTNPTASQAELIATMPENIDQTVLQRFYEDGNCHMINEQQIWVVKDHLAPSWCQVAALNDSNVFFSDLMKQYLESARQSRHEQHETLTLENNEAQPRS